MSRRLQPSDFTGLKANHANFVIEYLKDMAAGRAAEASGFARDTGHSLLLRPDIAAVLQHVMIERLDASMIDAEWLLMELVDNHMLARQQGNVSASNTALGMVGKHTYIDAFAAEKVEVSTDKEVMERLLRARRRKTESDDVDDEVSFF